MILFLEDKTMKTKVEWKNKKPTFNGIYDAILFGGQKCLIDFNESTKVICDDGSIHNSHEIQYWFEDYDDVEFLLGGIFEYIFEMTDYWDHHESEDDAHDFILDFANKLKNGMTEDYLPPKTPCTCVREWSEDRMKNVKQLIRKYYDRI